MTWEGKSRIVDPRLAGRKFFPFDGFVKSAAFRVLLPALLILALSSCFDSGPKGEVPEVKAPASPETSETPDPEAKPTPPVEEKAEPAKEAKEKESVLLFDGKTIDAWEHKEFGGSGEIEIKDGGLFVGEGNLISGAKLKNIDAIPVGKPYELSFETMQGSGVDFFCGLTFPVDDLDTCATLIIGGWGGGVIGISSIDGLDASENQTAEFLKFEKEQWYKVRLRVVPGKRLQLWLDGKQIADANTENSKVGMRAGDIEEFMPFGFATYQTEGYLRNLRVKPVEGPAPTE